MTAPASSTFRSARRRKSAELFDALTLPPGIIGVAGVLFALALVLALSFRHNNGTVWGDAWTPTNFAALASPLYRLVIGRSLWIAAGAAAATILLAYPAACFIRFHAGRHQAFLLSLVTLPFWTSYLLRVFAWKAILGYNGALNSGLLRLHLIAAPLQSLLYRPQAVLLTLSHAYAAFALLPIYSSLRAIDPRVLDAARDLGAPPATVFLRIILPLSLAGVFGAFVLVFIPTLGDYATPQLVGGLGSTMIGNLIEAQFASVGNWPFGCALAVALMALIAPPLLLAAWAAKRLA